ncbi:hypothetical protein C6H68_20220 [Photorhabdus luminescens]|nr:hypothetical protein C6H68_20220 [Photorhabdus luminescens]
MRTEHTRSIQTISHSTEVIDSFKDKNTDKLFCVLRLSERLDANRQLFIVTLNDDNKGDNFYIALFTELVVIRERVKYLVSPENQYPEFV